MTPEERNKPRVPHPNSVKKMVEEINTLNQEAWDKRRTDTHLTHKLAELALTLSRYAQYEKGIGDAYLNLSTFEGYQGSLDKAADYAEQAMIIFERIEDPVGQIRTCNVFGYLFIIRSELGKAFEYLLKGIQLSKKHDNSDLILFFFYNIAEIYKNTLSLYNEALNYLLMALPLIQETPTHTLSGAIYASISLCYQKTGDIDKAFYYAQHALDAAELSSDKQTLSICYHMLAILYKEVNDYDKARFYVDKEISVIESHEDNYGVANSSLTASQIYLAQNDIDNAVQVGLKGLGIVEKNHYKALTYHYYLLLAQCYEYLEDYKCATAYYQQYVTAYEAVMTLEVENRITVLLAELKQEEQLRELNLRMHNEKMVALADIVTGVAHEINTPLGNAISIASFLHDLKKELAEKHQAHQLSILDLNDYLISTQDSLDMLQQSLRRTANIVDSFKDVAMNQHALDLKTFSLNVMLDDLSVMLLPELKAQHVMLEIICPPQFIMTGYEELMRFVLTHLIQNALLHAFESTVNPLIRLSVWDESKQIHISVCDNGIGIPSDHLSKIYNPFFTTKKANGGIGLGLNIVYNMIHQLMNGKISVHSNARSGTTFDLYFPKNHN